MHEKEMRVLRELGLRYSPVAVKFVKRAEEMPEWARELVKRRRIRACQMLMDAKHGESSAITPENFACPAAASAFGFAPLPEKISSGEMLCALGLFMSKEAGRRTMEVIPRLKEKFHGVIAQPLERAEFKPDVIVIEDIPEVIMWLLLADLYREGGRHTFSTSVIQACCVDVTSYVFQTKKVNASFGCYGCREASDLRDDEAMIGIPYERFPEIVEAVRMMKEKGTIERVRRKGVLGVYMKMKQSER
ncbi:MAG: hypothetical protein PWR09_553 [Archaeoglobi archaeon]|nr:hypothetical protein [Archaeoglobi archaeon]